MYESYSLTFYGPLRCTEPTVYQIADVRFYFGYLRRMQHSVIEMILRECNC